MGLLQGIFCLIGVLLISCSEVTLAQTKRASRITSSRAFGINSKTNSNGVDFNCPEEFGYYPHPSDCTQYYVCVFGGALLESCTGGLMYSHELQTCDWPRNVGCEVQDARSSPSTSYRDISQGRALQQPQPQQHIRFSSTTSKPTIAQQYHRQPSQSIQVQNPVQTLPPPPELSRIAPNPVITSRGQPKPIIDSQEDIAKLYADTHDTLPPIEEEESDRQQRVYRGQPSTLSQVQRDRDGIIHHSNANAIPNHGKVGSYAFGSAINQYRTKSLDHDFDGNNNALRRRKRDLDLTETNFTLTEEDYEEDLEENVRTTRQLRPRARWQTSGGVNYRSVDSNPYQQQTYSFGVFNPYLSPPAVPQQNTYKTNPVKPQLKQKTKTQPTTYNYDGGFQPIAFTSQTPQHNYGSQSAAIPAIYQSVRDIQEKHRPDPENFSYFHLLREENAATDGSEGYKYVTQYKKPQQQTQSTPAAFQPSYPNQYEKVTPRPHYQSFSTIGGFYNNHIQTASRPEASGLDGNNQVISQYSIGGTSTLIPQQTTESNYFKYNILQNQRMKIQPSHQPFYAGERPPAVHLLPKLEDPTDFRPITTTTTLKPRLPSSQVNNFNFESFMQKLKETDMQSLDPSAKKVLEFIQHSNNFTYHNLVGKVPHGRQPFRPLPPIVDVPTTPRIEKGYESFIKSIPNPIPHSTERPTLFDYDDEEEEDDDYDINPPQEKPAYMPSSETMAPRPHMHSQSQATTPYYRPDGPHDVLITTRRPFIYQPQSPPQPHLIQPYIHFPNNFFQQMKPFSSTTMTPLTEPTTTTMTTTTTTPEITTTRKIYTIRPNPNRNRGNMKWKITKTTNKPNYRKRPSQDEHVEQELDDNNRDVEYTQQQLQPPQQQQQQVRGKSTYRPNEQLVTTPLPISVPQPPRDSFNKPILKPKEPQYNSNNNNNNPPPQQAHSPFSYSTDYEDSLVPQLEDENEYNEPTRQPIREEVEIQPLNGKPIIVSSTFGPPTNEIDDEVYYTSTRRPLYVPTTPLYTTTMRTTTSTTTTRRTVPITTPREEITTTTPTIIQRRKPINSTTPSVPTKRINNNRNRGSATHFSSPVDTDKAAISNNRGTHPPSRSRPTLKPASDIVSKTQTFIDIYRHPPTRHDPLYPQPTPDRTAAKCRKDVCLLPDCYCGGKDIPGDMPVESVPQIVLLTFDDSVNDLNKQLYSDLFEKGRVNPNGCPISATFYVSHEWTDYSQVQNLYSDGHEMASHTVSHSFGEQFSQKKWTKEVSGQREILSAYGGVKLSDIKGMRAPFLSIGGNKMFKMLYDSNFTYDSSMPVYENRPPSWPYTLDYKIFHDCMIPPCPTKSYPGVWEVPMVMWQDLNGGRCSMGDACSNPGDSDGVFKMIMKNFERHYTTNRAPFGLFYHAAWFTQPHHKAGFIKFLDAINSMNDVWIVTNTQALQWVRDPTPLSRINSFQPFQCDFSDRPKRCNNPKVCNLWHKSGVRYMRTCQPCPDIYPWTGKTGIRSSRVDTEIIEE